MESGNFLRDIIQRSKGIKYNTLSELAELAKVNQGNLSSFMKPDGDPKRRENMTFDSAWKILNVLGIAIPNEQKSMATIHRMGAHSPVETVEGDTLTSIPVVGEAGAGTPSEFFSCTPESWLPVLPLYFLPDVRAFKVIGDSMEPTIMKGSYVGVVPFSGRLTEGGIYLVDDHDFGMVVKRVRKDRSGTIMLFSDNPSWEPIPMPYEGYDHIIAGEVCWVWQLLR